MREEIFSAEEKDIILWCLERGRKRINKDMSGLAVLLATIEHSSYIDEELGKDAASSLRNDIEEYQKEVILIEALCKKMRRKQCVKKK